MKKKRFLASLLCCSLLFTSNSMLTFASSTTMTATFTATAEVLGGDLMITIPDEISLTKNGDVMTGSGVVTAQGVIHPDQVLFISTDVKATYKNESENSIKVDADVDFGDNGEVRYTAEELKANAEEDLKPNPNESNKLSHTVTVTLPMTDVEYIGDYTSDIVFTVDAERYIAFPQKCVLFTQKGDNLIIRPIDGGMFDSGWVYSQCTIIEPKTFNGTTSNIHPYNIVDDKALIDTQNAYFPINKEKLVINMNKNNMFKYFSNKLVDFIIKKPTTSGDKYYSEGNGEYIYLRCFSKFNYKEGKIVFEKDLDSSSVYTYYLEDSLYVKAPILLPTPGSACSYVSDVFPKHFKFTLDGKDFSNRDMLDFIGLTDPYIQGFTRISFTDTSKHTWRTEDRCGFVTEGEVYKNDDGKIVWDMPTRWSMLGVDGEVVPNVYIRKDVAANVAKVPDKVLESEDGTPLHPKRLLDDETGKYYVSTIEDDEGNVYYKYPDDCRFPNLAFGCVDALGHPIPEVYRMILPVNKGKVLPYTRYSYHTVDKYGSKLVNKYTYNGVVISSGSNIIYKSQYDLPLARFYSEPKTYPND